MVSPVTFECHYFNTIFGTFLVDSSKRMYFQLELLRIPIQNNKKNTDKSGVYLF